MKVLSKIVKNRVGVAFLLGALALSGISCSNKSYPCPGLGQADAADLSMFNSDGQLKDKHKKKGRINKETGIVNKKNPKKIQKQRRTKI